MTTNKYGLKLNRLLVMRNSGTAYDQVFHGGVNIIRGENGSGKSTIADLIFFGLGGDLKRWTREALLCTDVYAELDINGRVVTARRPIENERARPMFLKEENIDAALSHQAGWSKYPYQRSENIKSFSDQLFGWLGFPIHKTMQDDSITMHQILRLLYDDQETPFTQIFRFEQFDKPSLKQAIADLLLGTDDLGLYELRTKLRELEREHDKLSGELSALYHILGKHDPNFDTSIIKGSLNDLQAEIDTLRKNLEDLRAKGPQKIPKNHQNKELNELRDEISLRGVAIAEYTMDLESLVPEIDDSVNFIKFNKFQTTSPQRVIECSRSVWTYALQILSSMSYHA